MTTSFKMNALFKSWKCLHENEDFEIYGETAPSNSKNEIPEYDTFKGSFCTDGFLSQNEKADMLFICKESNVNGTKSDGLFWLKEVVQARAEGNRYRDADYRNDKIAQRRDRTAQTKYFNCLSAIAQKILNDWSNKNILQNCAYMNINKRGGYSTCNEDRLKKYACIYSDKILQQLKILNPGKVVLLGVSLDIFPPKIKEYLNTLELWQYSYHPCRYKISEIDSNLKVIDKNF